MQKASLVMLLLACLLLSACSKKNTSADTATEIVPIDYSIVREHAQNEFNAVFSEFSGLEITETKFIARTNDKSRIIIEFTYSTDSSNGVYGFEYSKDEYGNYVLLQQGESVNIYNLTE